MFAFLKQQRHAQAAVVNHNSTPSRSSSTSGSSASNILGPRNSTVPPQLNNHPSRPGHYSGQEPNAPFLPSASLNVQQRVSDSRCRHWISTHFPKVRCAGTKERSAKKTKLREAVLNAQIHAGRNMKPGGPLPTPGEIAEIAFNNVKIKANLARSSTEKYLKKKAKQFEDNISATGNVVFFGTGKQNPRNLGLSGPIAFMQDGVVLELPFKPTEAEQLELRSHGVKLKFDPQRDRDGDGMFMVTRNLAYDQNDRRIPIHKRLNIVKVFQSVDPNSPRATGVELRPYYRGQKGNQLLSMLPKSDYLPEHRSVGVLPDNPVNNMPHNGRFMQVLDLTCESAMSVLGRIRKNSRKFDKSEQRILRYSMGVSLLGGMAAMHGNISPSGKPQPITHGDPSLKNLRLGVDNTFRLQNFGAGYVIVEPEKPGMETDAVREGREQYLRRAMQKDARKVGRELYLLATGRRAPADYLGNASEWKGHKSSDAELQKCRDSRRMKDIACLLTQEDPQRCISLPEAFELLKNHKPEVDESTLAELLARERMQLQPQRQSLAA